MEMTNNRVTFDKYEGNTSDLVAYEEITGHFIFDVNFSENLYKKGKFFCQRAFIQDRSIKNLQQKFIEGLNKNPDIGCCFKEPKNNECICVEFLLINGQS